jgi:2-oxoglutarate ferredoxin oxidoreductase subunit gamma
MAKTEIRVSGLGGQGVILCSTIIGKAASIFDKRHATMIQAFGPEARGSACSAQVTMSDDVVAYPYVKTPDVLVTMSPDAYRLFISQLKPGGMLLYECDLVTLDTSVPAGVKTYGVPATRIAEEIGKRVVLNIVMVGFFTGVTGLISHDSVEQAVRDSIPAGTEKLNLAAFERGYAYGVELRNKPAEAIA